MSAGWRAAAVLGVLGALGVSQPADAMVISEVEQRMREARNYHAKELGEAGHEGGKLMVESTHLRTAGQVASNEYAAMSQELEDMKKLHAQQQLELYQRATEKLEEAEDLLQKPKEKERQRQVLRDIY